MSLIYSLRLRNGSVITSRSATIIESLSGDDDLSGDPADGERDAVSNGSAPAIAASTRRTISLADRNDGLEVKIGKNWLFACS